MSDQEKQHRTRRSRRLLGETPTPVKTPASVRRRHRRSSESGAEPNDGGMHPSSSASGKKKKKQTEQDEEPFQELSGLAEKLTSEPFLFLQPDPELSAQLLRSTKHLFDAGRQANQRHFQHPQLKHLLPELCVEGFSAEQIWEMLRMDYTSKLDTLEHLLEQETLLLEESEDDTESESEDGTEDLTDASEAPPDSFQEEKEEEEDYEEALRRQFDMEAASEGEEEDEADDVDDDDDDEAGEVETSEGEEEDDEEEDEEEDEDSDESFSESEGSRKSRKLTTDAMIGDDHRQLELDPIPSGRRRNRKSAEEDLDGVDFFEGELCEEFADFELGDDGDPDILDALYGTGHRIKDDDEDEEEEEDDEEDEMILGQTDDLGPKMKYNDFFLGPTEALLKNKESAASRYQKQQVKMAEQIQQLEEELIKPRPWQQMGEIAGSQRPAESLLEEFLEFERQDRVTAPDVELTTSNLEAMIRRRILEEDFDDVELKAPPAKPGRRARNTDGDRPQPHTLDMAEAEGYRPGALVDTGDGQLIVNDQRPEIGLAEIYERQYLDTEARETGAATQAETELSKQHQEIGALFARLSYDLDSLSNLHFTPQPFIEDKHSLDGIQSSHAHAIDMEEVLPISVSTAQQIAPQEQYMSKDALSSSGPADKSEMTREEKQRLRRAKKRRWKSRQKKVEEYEKTMATLDPTGRFAKKVELRNAEKRIKKSSMILDMSQEHRGRSRARMDASVIQDALLSDQLHREQKKLQRHRHTGQSSSSSSSSSQTGQDKKKRKKEASKFKL